MSNFCENYKEGNHPHCCAHVEEFACEGVHCCRDCPDLLDCEVLCRLGREEAEIKQIKKAVENHELMKAESENSPPPQSSPARGEEVIGEQAPQQQEEAVIQAEIEEAIAPYAKGLDSDPEVLWAEAIAFVRRAQEVMFEAGRRFIVLKERLGHGEFVKELDSRGINRTRVWELMIITRKFANVRALEHLGKTKLLALSHASDEEIQQLEETGKIMDIPQEELAGMSYREIQAAVKKYKARLEKKDKQIDEIEEKLKKTADELEQTKSNKASPNYYEGELEKLDKHIMEAVRIVGGFPVEALREDFDFQNKVLSSINVLERVVDNLNREYTNAVCEEADPE